MNITFLFLSKYINICNFCSLTVITLIQVPLPTLRQKCSYSFFYIRLFSCPPHLQSIIYRRWMPDNLPRVEFCFCWHPSSLHHCFSSFNMHAGHLGILLKCRFRFCRSLEVPENLHYSRFSGAAAAAAGLRTALSVKRGCPGVLQVCCDLTLVFLIKRLHKADLCSP